MGLINNKENKGDNMNSVKVTVNGNIMEVTNGTSLEELSKLYQDNFKYEIILAKIDGIYEELTTTIHKNCILLLLAHRR